MRPITRIAMLALPAAALLAVAQGCKDESSQQKASQNPAASSTAQHPAATPTAPSQAELDAKASKDIDEKNADAEFEKLKKELQGGGGG
jgi:hypothetical protein